MTASRSLFGIAILFPKGITESNFCPFLGFFSLMSKYNLCLSLHLAKKYPSFRKMSKLNWLKYVHGNQDCQLIAVYTRGKPYFPPGSRSKTVGHHMKAMNCHCSMSLIIFKLCLKLTAIKCYMHWQF